MTGVLYDTANAQTFLDGFAFIAHNVGFLAQKALEQLELSGAAIGVGAAVALPVGITLGHLHRGSGIAISASIFVRALPSILLIAIFLTILGIGFTNNMLALAVLATGPMLTNAYAGVDGVDRDVTDAARGMGMSRLQVLTRVELPLAAPLVFAGIRLAALIVVASATIAAIAGGGGLGDIIVNQASYRLQGVLGACYCVMALSAGVWLVLLVVQNILTPRALRTSRVLASGDLSRKEML
jgi:osmoprotectant transport system permease protein